MARNMARTLPISHGSRSKLDYMVPNFGTLDNTNDPTGINDVDSPDTLNTVYDTIQSVATRQGYVKLLTTLASSFIGGMFPLYRSDGTKQLLYASGNQWFRYNNAGAGVALTGVPNTFTADQMWSTDEFQDSMYAGNGSDPLIAYNGTTITTANGAISPQFVKIHKNRVYCANKNSSILYFSDAGSPTSFPANNFIQINTNDGQNITGIDELGDSLIIFKDESVWLLTGEPLGAGNTTTIGNLQLRQANSDVGCSAFRTIKRVGQVLFFMHYTGIYYLQDYTVYPVTDGRLSKLFTSTYMNPGFLNKCWAVYSSQQNKYIMGFPSAVSTTPDMALVYDTQVKGFSLWDHIPGSVACVYKFTGNQQSIMMGDPNKGNIFQLFQGYADIAGYNGTATGGAVGTLTDSTAAWTTNQFADCRVLIGSPLGTTQTAIVLSNTATTLTFVTALPTAPVAGQPYSIGYYNSYWKTKWHDFEMTGYTKKYRFFNLFCDAANYNILFGYATDFATLGYQKQMNIGLGSKVWGQGGLVWGSSSGNWGTYTSEFAQANTGSNGRYIAFIFGNTLANQPWRALKYSASYKQKKMRANIVST